MLIWVLWVLLAANCCGQALGTWKMIPAKSRQSSGPIAEALTVKYEDHPREAQPGAETWTFYLVRADGTSETTSQSLRFDGKEHPCGDLGLEDRPDTVVATKIDPRRVRCPTRSQGGLPAGSCARFPRTARK
jgi:hypothetical protein